MNTIRYSVQTWQNSYGERRWHFTIKKHMRVTFKRSKREGWRWLGFVSVKYPPQGFDTRADALAFGLALKKGLFTPQK
jgi:hypothetical protein